jgi:hypothetical protein
VFAALISQVSSTLTTACDKSYPSRVFPYAAWKSETWKTAARAGLRQIGRMVQQGNVAGASALAKTPGVLKPSAAGSQLRTLGTGSEGVASLVAHPEHGVAVRKVYDPKGLATPEMISRKENVGRALGANPNVAQFYGSAPTPQGGGTMHFSEFVNPQGPHAAPAKRPVGPLTPAQEQADAARKAAVEKTRQGTVRAVAGSGQGFSGAADVRDANMVWDGSSGRFKSVDIMPTRRGEFWQPSPSQPTTYRDPVTGGVASTANSPNTYGRDPRGILIPTARGHGLLNQGAGGVSMSSTSKSLLGNTRPGRPLAAPATLAEGSGRPLAAGSAGSMAPNSQPTTNLRLPPKPSSQEATAFLGRR